jgi:hypothetical protein
MPYALTVRPKYAKAGELVTVVNTTHLPVLICRSANGNLFPCRVEDLGEEKPAEVVQVASPKPTNKKLTAIEKLQIKLMEK